MKSNTATIVLAALTAAVIAVAVLLFFGNKQPANQFAGSDAYARIVSSGTIRVAYAIGAPLFTIDPNSGQKSGIFYDITNTAAAHLGLKVDWTEEVGYGEMIQGLSSGRYDIVGSGVWINADRGKSADFTLPLYYDAVYAYAKTGDNRIKSDLSNLNSPAFTISTMDGELGASIASSEFPNAKTLDLPQNSDFSQPILNVVNGKADVVFLAASPALAYQAANPGKIAAIDPGAPVRIFPNAIMVPQGQYDLRQALNYAITEMLNDGEVDAILKKYETTPGTFLRVAQPYQSLPNK